jgi:tetrahydromethanopterin S-methyltransferase subunit B
MYLKCSYIWCFIAHSLASDISPWTTKLNPTPVHVGFVVDYAALGQVSFPVVRGLLVRIISLMLNSHLYFSSITIRRNNGQCLGTFKQNSALADTGEAYPRMLNPSTPELNPSAQRCLTRYFTGDFASWTVHFFIICVRNEQMQQLFIQFINYAG